MAQGKNILVSGGAGYIGSHTALALRDAGYQPVIIDNLATSDGSAANKFGPFRKGDVGDQDFIRSVCQEFQPSALIHFAAFSLVGESVQNPEKYFDNNTNKASRLFDVMREQGVRHVVFSSTAAVYGAVNSSAPITETQPTNPINPYGESKLGAERYLRSLDNMTSVALRYFNAAGAAATAHGIGEAHWPESHLIPNTILAAIPQTGKRLSVFGTDYETQDGTAVRDYIHVIDLAQAHVQALDYLFKGGKTEVCNLGTGTGSSVMEVVRAVEKAMGAHVNRELGPRREGDPAFLVADNTKAKAVLGWQPEQDLDSIVRSAVEWHRTPAYQSFLANRLKPG